MKLTRCQVNFIFFFIHFYFLNNSKRGRRGRFIPQLCCKQTLSLSAILEWLRLILERVVLRPWPNVSWRVLYGFSTPFYIVNRVSEILLSSHSSCVPVNYRPFDVLFWELFETIKKSVDSMKTNNKHRKMEIIKSCTLLDTTLKIYNINKAKWITSHPRSFSSSEKEL